eukprot:366739-Pyramimonas_sp.AAC.1
MSLGSTVLPRTLRVRDMLKNPEVFYSPLEFSLELRSPIRDGEEGGPEGSNPTPHESPPGPQR